MLIPLRFALNNRNFSALDNRAVFKSCIQLIHEFMNLILGKRRKLGYNELVQVYYKGEIR